MNSEKKVGNSEIIIKALELAQRAGVGCTFTNSEAVYLLAVMSGDSKLQQQKIAMLEEALDGKQAVYDRLLQDYMKLKKMLERTVELFESIGQAQGKVYTKDEVREMLLEEVQG